MEHLPPILAPQFVATKSANDIAIRLRKDEALINAAKPCSWIAWHLPAYSTEKGKDIAEKLMPIPNLSHDIRETIYENLVKKIRRYLKDGQDHGATHALRDAEKVANVMPLSELTIALNVIRQLQDASIIQHDTPAEAVASWLEQQITPQAQTSGPANTPPPSSQSHPDFPCRKTLSHW
jgi:hypothetical protein